MARGSEQLVAVAVRLRGVDSGVRVLTVAALTAGALLEPDRLADLQGSDPNVPADGGYVALDGLSNTAYLLCGVQELPLPKGWHVFRAEPDPAGVEAMKRVARSLAPMSQEEELGWAAWLASNPSEGQLC